MIRKRKKIIPVVMLAFILCLSVVYNARGKTNNDEQISTKQFDELFREEQAGKSYREYRSEHTEMSFGKETIKIDAANYLNSSGDIKKSANPEPEKGKAEVVYTGEDSRISWEFTVGESGLYNINLDYYPAQGNGNDIERNLYLDGEIPFNEAKFLTFSRIWADKDKIKQDKNGNDIRPKQGEIPEWMNTFLYDSSGHYNEPLQFYFEKGTHILELQAVREPMLIQQLTICKAEELPSYEQVKENYQQMNYQIADANPIKIQAEDAFKKSDYTLYPATDRSSAITEPQDASKVKLNCISGDKFKFPGQWVSWKVDVPEDGLYQIALRYKQNLLSGLYASRKVLIDGAVPFKEASDISFNYSDSWEIDALGSENEDFMFYLTKGEHEISVEVTLGKLAPVITDVSDSLTVLNNIYRKILMITGPEPDQYRDYSFERQIPQVIESMKEQADNLERISKMMEELVSGKGEKMAIIDKLTFQLNRMYEDPEKIATSFTSYKDNIAALATWILTVSEQPLSIDYLYITPAGKKLPKAEAGFFKSMGYEIESLVMSFFVDYNSLGLTENGPDEKDIQEIEVWLTSGRDQVSILREMINDSFTPETNIRVNLKLVDATTLLPSVLAGVGPDVSLGNPIGDPIQYAIRNALTNLNDFPDYKEVEKRFHPSAIVSYKFDDKVYALPETQSFQMMFYRKDILSDLGLSIPQTWEEFYAMIPELQKNNMEMGFPSGLPGMQIFLYQNGGSLYNSDWSRSTLDEDLTIDAFQQLCELFTTYKFPRDFDFPNRFRTGQMPIGIQDYTAYNNLTAFAPEIKGLWEFAPIPGTMQEDGTINRAEPCTGTCAIMMKDTKNPEAAWRFMEWWTRAESQSRFAQEMESVLGKAAKYATANMEAMSTMPWSQREHDLLMIQWDQLVGTPEVPGGYYLTRSVDFATKTAYTTGDGEVLLDYAKAANDEIKRKRKEFGLE